MNAITVDDSVMTENEFRSWERGDITTIGKYMIKPKRDFGPTGYLVKGKMIKTGWIITEGGMLATPGATWAATMAEAKKMVGALMASKGDANVFYGLLMLVRED